MKKLLSMIMAIAMVASLAATAFATGDTFTPGTGEYPSSENFTDTTKTFTSTVKSKVKAPTIKVTIPTTNNVYLNPYKMSVTIDSTTHSDEIVALPTVIKSASDCKLAFSAIVTGKASTGVTLEKASVKKTATDGTVSDAKNTNSVYMFVYFAAAADEATAKALTVPAADATSGAPNFAATSTNPDINAIVVQTTASKSTKVLELEAAASDSAPTWGAFTVGGDIVAAPTTPWTDKHTVDVTVALSIAPVQATPAAPTGG